jgi:hypothetical protein
MAQAAVPPVDWRRQGLVAAFLCALVLAAYGNCFHAGFVLDNKPIVLEDPRVHAATSQNIGAIWSKGYWFTNQDPALYRPLTTISYLFNYVTLGNGANPAGYHWVNLTLHAINALLAYALCLVLFRKTAPAVAASALWAVHPVLTESVTNIVGRADLLACFGVLAGLLCHIKAVSATGRRKFAWLTGLVAAAAIGIFSKESAVALIPLMLAYDLAARRPAMRACVQGYSGAAAPLSAFLYMRSQALATLPAAITLPINNPLVRAGFGVSKLTAIQVIGRYLWLLVWPRNLSCDYSYNQIPLFRWTFDNWSDWGAVLALAVCLAAAGLAAWCFRRSAPGFFFIVLFFVALAPVANIAMPIGTIMAERLLYLPAVGFIGCVVWALYAAMERLGAPRATGWIIGLLCLALAMRTHLRNRDWENERTLWTSGVESAPASYKTHLNLAVEYFRDPAGVDRAIAEAERSLAILDGAPPASQDAMIYADVGAFYRVKGDAPAKSGAPDAANQSRFWYRKSLEMLLRGVVVENAVSEAAARANRAARKQPGPLGEPRLYKELGRTNMRLEQPGDAIQALEHGLSLEPGYEFLQQIADAHAALDDRDGAAIALMEGAVMYPEQRGFPSELLKLYEGSDASPCAVERTASGLNLNLGCPLVHSHLCAAMARVGDLYAGRGQNAEAEKTRLGAVQSMGCPAR